MLQQKILLVCLAIKLVFSRPTEELTYRDVKKIPTPVVLKLDAEQFVETIKSVINSDFVQKMANNIATKAVENFIQEVKTQHKALDAAVGHKMSVARERVKKLDAMDIQREDPPLQKPKKKKQRILDQNVALTLLRDPSPDGDNLGLDSLEAPVTVQTLPMKINGVYMRRGFDEEEKEPPSMTAYMDHYGSYDNR